MIESAVYQDNKVALLYYAPIPKMVRVNEKEYVTDVRNRVSMLWADEEDVQSLLDLRGGCCGKKQQMFTLASEIAFKVWKDGHY